MKTTRPPHESRYVTGARIAYQLAQASVPRYAHPKSPHRFTQPQVVACVLLTLYLDLSYRDMEEWLLASDKVCAVLELDVDVPCKLGGAAGAASRRLRDWRLFKDSNE
jgi:hypothetical protein